MNLTLTDRQAVDLNRLIEARLRDLGAEIAESSNPGCRDELTARSKRLAQVSEQLHDQLGIERAGVHGDRGHRNELEAERSHPGG